MNKLLVLDSSTIISMASSCLLWVFKELKSVSGVRFFITPSVKFETIDNAVNKKRWMLEALRVKMLLNEGVFELNESKEIDSMCSDIMKYSNSIFFRGGEPIHIIHKGECEILALSKIIGAEVIGVDEKTTRLLIEDYKALWSILENKLHTKISFHEQNYKAFMDMIGKKYIIRSTEIVGSAFQQGILQKRVRGYPKERDVIEASLWALKFSGCAISENEIKRYVSKI
ncbi:MAG: hypothetical protein PHW96_00165 [Candidatus Nanoarchaeia archaeon]|nr:hypothetical protein [Candidatus Nanoarchaeia archaeon]